MAENKPAAQIFHAWFQHVFLAIFTSSWETCKQWMKSIWCSRNTTLPYQLLADAKTHVGPGFRLRMTAISSTFIAAWISKNTAEHHNEILDHTTKCLVKKSSLHVLLFPKIIVTLITNFVLTQLKTFGEHSPVEFYCFHLKLSSFSPRVQWSIW